MSTTHETGFEPDIIDLQAWICTSSDTLAASAWQMSKYHSSPYEFWLAVWKAAGRPNISMEAAY